MRRVVLILFAVSAALLSACGDDDDAASGDVERYCELTAELEAAGEAAFENADEDAEESAVLAEFFEVNAETFDELKDVAPDEISEDVETLHQANLDFIDGDESGLNEAEAADDRLTAFAESNC